MVQIKVKKVVSEGMAKELKSKLGEERFAILQRIWDAYNYLVDEGKVNNVTDLAEKTKRNYPNVTSIINGKRSITPNIITDMNKYFGYPFNQEWIMTGKGDMLANKSADDIQKASTVVNQAWANNSPNAMVNAAYNGNITISDNNTNDVVPNHYGDSPDEERRWCPVVPTSMARQGNFDIMGHVSKQIGGSMERLYAGTAPIDVWHYVTDNDLYPFYQKGDCLGLKAYDIDDRRIKTGNVYVVDTNRDGFIFRRFRLLENGDFESYTFNESDPQSYVIPKEDIIRVYSVVLMFRY
jgi:plasmid maintenance system antidote protein VapI